VDFGRNASAWYGWAIFAGAMLLMLGCLSIFYGIFTLAEDEVLVAKQDDLIVLDLTLWGLVVLIFGGLLVLAGLGLFTANPAARWVAIVVAGLHALWQMWSLHAYPVWSIMVIALDVVVIYALTAHWAEVRHTVREDEEVVPPTRASVR
jgi:hypothetical protein